MKEDQALKTLKESGYECVLYSSNFFTGIKAIHEKTKEKWMFDRYKDEYDDEEIKEAIRRYKKKK